MDFVLESALNMLEFNETLFDIMVGEFSSLDPATEAPTASVSSDATGNQQTSSTNNSSANQQGATAANNNQNTNTNTNTNNDQQNQNTDNTETGQKQVAPGFWDKVKKVIDWLINSITDAINKFTNSIAYVQKTGKDFDKEIKNLEKKYKPRFGIKVENYSYNIPFLNFFKTSCAKYYQSIIDRVRKVIQDYESLLRGSMTAEDFAKASEDLADNNKFRGDIMRNAYGSLGLPVGSLDTDSELMKQVRVKFRGESTEQTIEQADYNECRTNIRKYNDNMREVNQLLNSWQQNAKDNQRILRRFELDSKVNSKSSKDFAKVFVNAHKLLNLPIQGIQFYMTCYNEYIVNARMICKKCLGG